MSSEATTTNEVQDDIKLYAQETVPSETRIRSTRTIAVETKKISLTPRLLRGDLDANAASEQSEARQKQAWRLLIGSSAADNEKPKEDKKKKEKKGMLSGLFKRKDKKARPGENEVDDAEKTSEESDQGVTTVKRVSRISRQAGLPLHLNGKRASCTSNLLPRLQPRSPRSGWLPAERTSVNYDRRPEKFNGTRSPKLSRIQCDCHPRSVKRTRRPWRSTRYARECTSRVDIADHVACGEKVLFLAYHNST